MGKIRITELPPLPNYINEIEESIRVVREMPSPVMFGWLNVEASRQYGGHGRYDERLEGYVDTRRETENSRMRREDMHTDTIIYEDTVNTNSQTDPNFRGTWGTPVDADDKLHTNTASSGNAPTRMGTSPGDYQMKSVYPHVTRTKEGKIEIKI